MNGNCFIDTNILVYAHDRSAGEKYTRAERIVDDLWLSNHGVISTQVLQELCTALRKRTQPSLEPNDVREIIRDFAKWNVFVNTAESVLAALELELRYKIRFWDALILNAAEETGCELLYSEDFSSGQQYGSVVVVNPFR